jgi:HK97 gp10 family phage protein
VARGDPLPQQYPAHPSGIPRFSQTPKKYAGMGRSPIKTSQIDIEMVGFNVLYEHFMAAAMVLDQTAPEMMNVVGDLGVEEARQLVPYDTGATHDSIGIIGGSSKYGNWPRMAGEYQYFVELGPETFYAPFLEYGTVYMTPRPFMLPALDLMEVALVASVQAIIAAVVDGEGGGLSGSSNAMRVLSDPRVRNPFSSLRSFLYSSSKALGDVSVLGGRSLFGPLRASMYSLARGLGDLGSIMNRTVNTRISNRLSGRVTGRLVGFGSATLSYGRTYSAFPGGASGHRVYQRFVGSHASLRGVTSMGASSMVNGMFGSG